MRITMQGRWVDHRRLYGNESLSWNIAHHFSTSHDRKAVVIAETPAALLGSVSKQWQKVLRQLQRQRSSTLDASKIYELTNLLADMQSIHMSAKHPCEMHGQDVDMHFMTVEQALELPPLCETLYVTVPIEDATLDKIRQRMPSHAM